MQHNCHVDQIVMMVTMLMRYVRCDVCDCENDGDHMHQNKIKERTRGHAPSVNFEANIPL